MNASRSVVESAAACAEVSAATWLVLSAEISFVVSEAMVAVGRDVIWEADRDEIIDMGARALCAGPWASEIERAAAFSQRRSLPKAEPRSR